MRNLRYAEAAHRVVGTGASKETEADMHTVLLIICGVLCAGVILWAVIHFGWSIGTQHRDHGNSAEGPILRRRVWSTRRPRGRGGLVNPEAYSGRPVSQQEPSRSAGISDDRA
jgi:hypothetical protein